MKRMIKCLTIVFLLSSCSMATDQANRFETPQSVSTTTVIPTRTTMPLESTPSPVETMTSSPTIVPTLTSLPTLTGPEAEKFIQGLYDNDVCTLPCWGGLVPGKTPWQEVQRLLDSININIPASPKPNFGVAVMLQIPQSGISFVNFYYRNNDTLEMIRPQIKTRTYDIQPLLIKYGKPDEIWIRTYATTSSGYLPFRVVLFYDRGIVIQYEHPAAINGDYLVGCLLDETSNVEPMLWVWNPDLYDSLLAFAQKTEALGADEEKYYQPLEGATNVSSEKFYQTAQQTGHNFCLRTPKSLW